MKKALMILAILLTAKICFAAIIMVPDDQSTIQAAVDAAMSGDTVLVEPGVYLENLMISHKSITLASLFLTTGYNYYISNTIIDGDSSGTVIRFLDYTKTHLIGFTIRHGYTDIFSTGGDIICCFASPTIENNIIKSQLSG